VDDKEINRRILREQLAAWGIKATSAENGPAALEVLRSAAKAGEPYDLAILDMMMPEMDGLELAQRVGADPSISSTKLIMLSSMGGRAEDEQGRPANIKAHLTKPVRQSRLYDAIAATATVAGAQEGTTGGTEPGADPLARHDLATARTDPHERAHERVARGHVLVAEDNQVNQKVAVRMLERLGYRADVAANGLEALEALSRIPYAAVLMDVQMPEMDGHEATAEIRRLEEGKNRRTPVIAMTANAMQGDREQSLRAGMDDYLAKPVKAGALEAVLNRWVSVEEEQEESLDAATDPAVGNGPARGDLGGEILDRSVLAALRELQHEGEPDVLGELIELFLADAPPRLVALREAAEAGDARTVVEIAHALKGSCSNMGAVGMGATCAELEEAARAGELSGAPARISVLEEEFGRVRVAFEKELSRP
jgi:CheY-like chemotaxis protein